MYIVSFGGKYMAKRFVSALLLLSVFLMVLAISCSEPPPGEVNGKVTKDGQNIGATMKAVQNGKTIGEDQSIGGVYYIRNLPPGDYTIQCCSSDGTVLKEQPATVEPEGSTIINFVLDK